MVIFSLLNITLPLEDFKFPAIKLNSVVFPDPLGPIIPVIEPFFILREQLLTAAKPPKNFEIFSHVVFQNYSFFSIFFLIF